MFTNIYKRLQEGFQQSRFKVLFQNTALAKLLAQDEEPSAWGFFSTYISSWWWNRFWFRSRLKNHQYEFDGIIRCLQILNKANISSVDNWNLVAEHANPSSLADALSYLQEAGILTQKNFALVKAHVEAHANPYYLADALCNLQRAGILTQENQNLVANHANPDRLADALSYLQQARILTQENQNLVANHANPDRLADALSYLQQVGILTQENFALVEAHVEAHANPYHLASALGNLQRAGILTQENFALVKAHVEAHANPYYLADALCNLQRAGILTQENQNLVANHANPDHLASALGNLQRAGILTQENFALVKAHVEAHANPYYLASALCNLQQANILTQENFALVAAQANPRGLADVLLYLRHALILTPENRDLAATHANPLDLSNALYYLQQAGILYQYYFALVAEHNNSASLAVALSYLQQARILTKENRNLVANHANPDCLASTLCNLQQAHILTQENFASLLAPNHGVLVSDQARQLIWSRIPRHLLTQANFERLLTAAENANPRAELQRIVNQILGVQAGAGHAAAFNPRQSTHTASVHESVSASAVRLRNSYGNPRNLEAKIVEIKAYIDGLDNTPEHQAAKRCIDRITAADYSFTDPTSQVSTRQLLALAYTAIHDKDKRLGSLEDAKAFFVEGLYEIQRGYNIELGQGPEQRGDYPICLAGTFNKLMEKLNGIHTDVELVFITHEGASSKFPRLAQERAKDYLQTQVESVNAGNHQSVQDLLERLTTAESLEPIWDAIKTQVQTQLWDEFSKAYGNNPEDARFLALIDQGHDVNCPDLTDVETAIQGLLGYQASPDAGACESVAQHSLWASSRSIDACDTKDLGAALP